MTKVVISRGVGSLVLSKAAVERLIELGNKHVINDINYYEEKYRKAKEIFPTVSEEEAIDGVETPDGDILFKGKDDIHWKDEGDFYYFPNYQMRRDDPHLVQVVEEMGNDAAPEFFGSKTIAIVEVLDDIEWFVDQYEGGPEFVREHHRTWSCDEDGNTIQQLTNEDY